MFLGGLFRLINKVNPTGFGRSYLTLLAQRYTDAPQNGVYETRYGFKMSMSADDYIERMIYYEAYEFLSSKRLAAYLKPGDIFIDIGANVGYYSLLARSIVGSDGHIMAFEPHPVTARKLRANIELNEVENIEVVEMALSNREETVELFTPGKTHNGETSMRNQGWDVATMTTVSSARLDDLVSDKLARVCCIKIDVEGAEKIVFEGATRLIRDDQPAILLEVNSKASSHFGFEPLAALKHLLKLNPAYQIYEISSHSVIRSSLERLKQTFELGDRSVNLWLVP